MDTTRFQVSLPLELSDELDKLKETKFQSTSYEAMLTSLVEEGLNIVQSQKRQAQAEAACQPDGRKAD